MYSFIRKGQLFCLISPPSAKSETTGPGVNHFGSIYLKGKRITQTQFIVISFSPKIPYCISVHSWVFAYFSHTLLFIYCHAYKKSIPHVLISVNTKACLEHTFTQKGDMACVKLLYASC